MKRNNPKTIHYCWFGGSPLPEKERECMESWKKYMPDWEIKEWNESNFDINSSAFSRGAYAAKKWAFVADYCRVKVLYEHGGIYLDTDMELLKPLDDVAKSGLWLGYEDSDLGRPNAAIMGTNRLRDKYLKILLDYYDRQSEFSEEKITDEYVIPELIRHEIFDKCEKSRMGDIDVYDGELSVYDEDYFYPIHYEGIRTNFTKNTHAIHRWAASWHSEDARKHEDSRREKNLKIAKSLEKPEMVSVVIPVYNNKKSHLVECLNSIKNQTFRNLEVIIVDDGSNKETSLFLDKWVSQRNDSSWKVLHQKNTGSLFARKSGAEQAKGQYIVFVDADDMLDSKAVEKLYFACIANKTEMAISEFIEFNDKDRIDKTVNKHWPKYNYTFDKTEIIRGSLLGGYDHINMRVWNGPMWAKLYKRSLLMDIDWMWANYQYNEDEFISIQTSAKTNGLSFVQEQLYYYRKGVADSKESQVPKYNYLNGKKMPILRTYADVYIKFKEFLEKQNIQYNPNELTRLYRGMLRGKYYHMVRIQPLDQDNRKELKRQGDIFMPIIEADLTIDRAMKIELAMLYYFQDGIDFIREKDSEIADLQAWAASLSNELNEHKMPGVKMSSRKLAGAIRRRLEKSKIFTLKR